MDPSGPTATIPVWILVSLGSSVTLIFIFMLNFVKDLLLVKATGKIPEEFGDNQHCNACRAGLEAQMTAMNQRIDQLLFHFVEKSKQ